jgi:GT2 family glycosyltransferase
MNLPLPRVSVIVLSYKSKENLEKCLEHCLKLNYHNFEIIVAGNIEPFMFSNNILWLRVNNESLGYKRNAAITRAKGEICAFIDDDAFPDPDWLRNSMKYFEDPEIGAVCGPGIPPDDESLMERGSSAVLASYLGSGPAKWHYIPCRQKLIRDAAPAVNLLVRRDLLLEIGGFPEGEIKAADDAIVSAKIRSQGKKILYVNDAIVFHKRRPLFIPLARQIGSYAFYRGFLLKKHKEMTSLFILFPVSVVAILIGAVLIILIHFSFLTLLSVGMLGLMYLVASFISGLRVSKSGVIALLTMVGIPLVNLTYSVQFFRGLATRKLNEK